MKTVLCLLLALVFAFSLAANVVAYPNGIDFLTMREIFSTMLRGVEYLFFAGVVCYILALMLYLLYFAISPLLKKRKGKRRKTRTGKKEAVANSYDVSSVQKALDTYIAEKKSGTKHYRRGDS